MAQRIIVALLYALAGLGAVIQTSGLPHTPEAWIGIVVAFGVAFWGKFSSSTTVVSPNRTGETFAAAAEVKRSV
jgi:hypothetical protein